MDLIDKKILCELDLNCRQPLSKLSKKLRLSRSAVDYRIKNLENQGVITKYMCSLNLGLLGYKQYMIYFKLHNHAKDIEKEFIKEIVNEKLVVHSSKTEGSFDYSVTIAVKTINELDVFLTRLKNEFSNLIKDYFVDIVVDYKIFKLNKLLLDKKEDLPRFEKYVSEEIQVKIDEADKKILRELSQKGNISIVELAIKTKLSIDMIKYRLKKLNKSLITSYRFVSNFNKLGYYHYLILLKIRKNTKKDEEKLVSWCAFRKNIPFCAKRIGYFDFEINAAITDINELNDFISELKTEFGEIIDSYEVMIDSQVLKSNYVPF